MDRDTVIALAKQAKVFFDDRKVNYCFYPNQLFEFAALVAAAERERAIEISKGMQEELQAKFEQTYMEGVIAGAAAEREECAKLCEWKTGLKPVDTAIETCAAASRARSES